MSKPELPAARVWPAFPIFVIAFALSLCLLIAGAAGAQAAGAFPPFSSVAQAQAAEHGSVGLRLRSAAGIAAFVLIAFGIGQLRRPRMKVNWRPVIGGVALQFFFAFLVLDTTPGHALFFTLSQAIHALLGFAVQGSQFLFGNLVNTNVPVGIPAGDPSSGPIAHPTAYANTGAYFAFVVLPTIVFLSTLSVIAYYSGIMQKIVEWVAIGMRRTMGTSGSETVAVCANIFVGQTEAPLLVKPYIATATNSELMAIMVAGFANIASGVLAAYAGMLEPYFPDAGGHLLAASIISAPSSLALAKLLLPEREESPTAGGVKLEVERTDANIVDATARGAVDGMQLAFNVGAMLIVFIALIALVNAVLTWAGGKLGYHGLTLNRILGWAGTPFAWLAGMPWRDARQVGPLLGVKTALNEFVAYTQLAHILGTNPQLISPRSVVIAIYALCGFANFSSIAIQVGGISTMAPNRRHDLARLAFTAMWGGAISSLISGCVVGVLL